MRNAKVQIRRDGRGRFRHNPRFRHVWYSDWPRGPHARRVFRRAEAHGRGWAAAQAYHEEGPDAYAECPYTKLRYVNQWLQGWADWERCWDKPRWTPAGSPGDEENENA